MRSWYASTFTRDDFGRLLSSASAVFAGAGVSFVYDARGNAVERSLGGATTKYGYDGADRLVSISAQNPIDGNSVAYTFRYDENGYVGKLTTIVASDHTIAIAYDVNGRVTREDLLVAGLSTLSTTYRYDVDGALQEIWYPSGLRVRYERDASTGEVTRVLNINDGTSYASSIVHAPGGPVSSLTFGNGSTLSATYDRRYQPGSIASGPLSLAYTMSPAGDVGTLTTGTDGRSFQYDFLDRLTGSPSWLAFTYNNSGDRTAETQSGASLTYGYYGNRLQSASAAGKLVNGYAYDYQTNVSGISVYNSAGTAPASALCLRHDALGRLVMVGTAASPTTVRPGANVCVSDGEVRTVLARFKYDARGRRIARWLASTNEWTYFVHDSAGSILSELARTADPGAPWARRRDYVWLDGQPLAQVEYLGATPAAEGYPYYFHNDHLAQPRMLTNAAGQTVWSAAPRPYGDLVESTTQDPLAGRMVVTNLRLPGQYDERLLGSVGLQGPYYNWNRWYLPGVGRYLELDPLALAGKFNAKYRPDWYGYAGGNPLRRIDRKGLNEQDYQDCVFNCELIGGACIVAAGVGCAITGPDYPVCAIGGVCLCVAMEQACEKDCEKKRWQ